MFKNEQMTVISPMKKMICNDDDRDTLRVPENVFMTDWLPADQVNPMCDAAIIHGGQGTVYTAIMSETPFCAIGNGNPEQEFNVEAATEHGFAKLFRRKSVRPSDILGGLKKLLNDKNAKTEIKRMASLLKRPEWNGEKRAAKKLEELFA